MQQAGDGHLRWGRAPRFVAQSVGAATWQQRATLAAAVVGAVASAWLIVHLLALELRIPGLGSPIRTPAFATATPDARPDPLRARSAPRAVNAVRPKRSPRAGRETVRTRPRASAPAAAVPAAPETPPAEAPAPSPPSPTVESEPAPAPASTPAATDTLVVRVPEEPTLPAIPLPVPIPSPEPLPVPTVPLPTIP